MFKISPIQDKELQKKYAKECLAEYIPEYFAFSMINQDDLSLMGFAQFDILSGVGYIHSLKPRENYSDFEAMFILGRAVMNFIDLCDVHACKAASDAAEERLLLALGFKKNDNSDFYVDMTGMFDGNCGGHNK